MLTRFFEDSRLYDTAALSRTATVVFNPRTDGVVQDFEIAEVGPELQSAGARSKEVTLDASVRTPEGRIDQRRLKVKMEQKDGAWLVTAVTPLRASQTSPAASSALPK